MHAWHILCIFFACNPPLLVLLKRWRDTVPEVFTSHPQPAIHNINHWRFFLPWNFASQQAANRQTSSSASHRHSSSREEERGSAEMLRQVHRSGRVQGLPLPGRAGPCSCRSTGAALRCALFRTAVLTVTVSRVKIMGIFYCLIRIPFIVQCLKQVEIALWFLRSLGGSS